MGSGAPAEAAERVHPGESGGAPGAARSTVRNFSQGQNDAPVGISSGNETVDVRGINLRTTALQKCAAVPRRAHIFHSTLGLRVIKKRKKVRRSL